MNIQENSDLTLRTTLYFEKEPTEYHRPGSFSDDDNQSNCRADTDNSKSDISKGKTDGSGSDSESALLDNLPHDYKLQYENNLSTELEMIAKKVENSAQVPENGI